MLKDNQGRRSIRLLGLEKYDFLDNNNTFEFSLVTEDHKSTWYKVGINELKALASTFHFYWSKAVALKTGIADNAAIELPVKKMEIRSDPSQGALMLMLHAGDGMTFAVPIGPQLANGLRDALNVALKQPGVPTKLS